MLKVTKKQAYIISGVGILALTFGGYYLFFRKDAGAYREEETPPEVTLPGSGVKVTANKERLAALEKFAKGTEIKQLTRSLLTLMNKNFGRNTKQIKNLIFERIPDDDYMKIFKAYFHCHTFTGRWFANDYWDLTRWLQDVFGSGDDWDMLLMKYPSLNDPITCIKKK
ncbi:MAG: hypothetical protein ACTTJI_03895 [Capnocytophaga sp.]|uniref:hypothetical protein n=1 Tax=Capnocytophaga sp. TaxID=44737 RepID=UPI003FA1663D